MDRLVYGVWLKGIVVPFKNSGSLHPPAFLHGGRISGTFAEMRLVRLATAMYDNLYLSLHQKDCWI